MQYMAYTFYKVLKNIFEAGNYSGLQSKSGTTLKLVHIPCVPFRKSFHCFQVIFYPFVIGTIF